MSIEYLWNLMIWRRYDLKKKDKIVVYQHAYLITFPRSQTPPRDFVKLSKEVFRADSNSYCSESNRVFACRDGVYCPSQRTVCSSIVREISFEDWGYRSSKKYNRSWKPIMRYILDHSLTQTFWYTIRRRYDLRY